MPAIEEKKVKKTKVKGKGKKKKKTASVSKADQKRLKVIAKALAYGVQQGFVDLERSTEVMSQVTLEETKAVIHSLMSSEKLNATAQGRQAQDWAGSSAKFTDKDAQLLFVQLDHKKTGKVDLQGFLDKIVGMVKSGNGGTEKTPKQIADEKREEFLKEVEWHTMEGLVTTFPVHIQRQIALARKKSVPKDVFVEEFDLRVPYGTDYLLDCAELKMPQRAKIALMGEGGSGKSVLFHAIANQEIKGFPDHLEVHHMKEIEVSPDAENLLDTVVHAHQYIMSLRRAKVELTNRIEGKEGHTAAEGAVLEGLKSNLRHVETKLKETGSEDAEENAAKSLRVLGFDDAAQQKSTNSLSGGLRMRVALCAAFFVQADILLLDEPTNHLDFPSLLWLENRLRSYRNIFCVVCHDREILANVCNQVIRIDTDSQALKYYDMGFEKYEKKLAKDNKKKAQEADKFLARNRNVDFSSPLAVQVKNTREWLDSFTRKEVLRAGQFTFPPPEEILPDNEQLGMTDLAPENISVIKVTDVRFSYDPVTLPFIFDTPINIDIQMGTRMGVMGPNGAGKSTFLKLITGRLQPVSGTITTNKNATIAYFAQHHSAEMDLNTTPTEFMISRFPEENLGRLRAHLGKVGCSGTLTQSRMNDLSQGMRSCILFAALTYRCPSLLIMDEPTNFLDIETVDALIGATNKYRGSLLLVSHSRLFLNKCATTYLSIVPGQFLVFDGLKKCEAATYSFIEELESGGKVKIGSGALAQHGANAEYGGSSEAAAAGSEDASGALVL
jgi:ATP-binding cassette subfamily F protein 3